MTETDLMNPDDASISQSQIEFIKTVIAKDRTENEITLMLHMAKKYKLDPLLGEIYLLPFKGQPARPYVSQAGMLAAAHQTGMFDGVETEIHYSEDGRVIGVTARVWRKDASHPFQDTVLMNEYNEGKSLWSTKPATMLGKVARSHALRYAFSLSGLYTIEEMQFEDIKRADTSRYEPLKQEIKERKKIAAPKPVDDGEPAF